MSVKILSHQQAGKVAGKSIAREKIMWKEDGRVPLSIF